MMSLFLRSLRISASAFTMVLGAARATSWPTRLFSSTVQTCCPTTPNGLFDGLWLSHPWSRRLAPRGESSRAQIDSPLVLCSGAVDYKHSTRNKGEKDHRESYCHRSSTRGHISRMHVDERLTLRRLQRRSKHQKPQRPRTIHQYRQPCPRSSPLKSRRVLRRHPRQGRLPLRRLSQLPLLIP
jgi:hypothetical protein